MRRRMARPHLKGGLFSQRQRMNREERENHPLPENSAEDDEGEEEEETEEDEEPKVCQVCGDQATGYHFNAMTCEGCKGFFRRAMKGPARFRCSFQKACLITKSNRRQCQACRLQKCLSIGMLKELIMSDEAVEKRRIRIKRRRMQDSPPLLTPQQETVIQELFDALHTTFDMTCSNFSQFRPIDRNLNPMYVHGTSNTSAASGARREQILGRMSAFSSCCLKSDEEEKRKSGIVFTTLSHAIDLTTHMIHSVIRFAKVLSSFKSLTIEDQIALLKGATFEIAQIRLNMLFNENTGIWECGPVHYCMEDAVRAGFQHHLLDSVMRFHLMLRRLRLHDVEYALMHALSLFSPDRPGVAHHKTVDQYQEMLALTLKTYIEVKRSEPQKHLLYPKIVSCLTELRSMNEEYTKQVMQIQDIQPEASPLILEVFSKDS